MGKSTKKRKTLKDSLASKGLYDNSTGKEKELKVLNGFLQRLQVGHHTIIPGERPDFFLNFSFGDYNASLGCELTYYFADKKKYGSAQARFVRQWKYFANSLRAALDAEGEKYKYLYGAIHFNNSDFHVLDRFGRKALITEIIVAIGESVETSNISNFNKVKFPLLAEHVDHIYLRTTFPETGILWWPSHLQSGTVNDPTHRLLEIIEEKNTAGFSYEWNNVDEKWLLIYSAAEGTSDMAVLQSDPEICNQLGKIRFDKVYLWSKFFESIDEIYPDFVNIFSPSLDVLHRKLYSPFIRPFILEPDS